MTTELEQKFYDTFGIEPECHNPIVKLSKDKKCEGICKNCEQYNYPDITAEKLLEMICILNDYEGIDVQGTTIEELKEELLNQCIEYFKYPIAFEENADLCNLHNKIQKLFKD